jgi:hypothetical protein
MKHGWNTRRLYFVNLELEMSPVTLRDCQLSSHLTGVENEIQTT